jgi:hypothetical protein
MPGSVFGPFQVEKQTFRSYVRHSSENLCDPLSSVSRILKSWQPKTQLGCSPKPFVFLFGEVPAHFVPRLVSRSNPALISWYRF